jgi:hypothetical protein
MSTPKLEHVAMDAITKDVVKACTIVQERFKRRTLSAMSSARLLRFRSVSS